MVRLIRDAAAPLAGLGAATLAYSAAAMLPVWLPMALGGGGGGRKRRTLAEFSSAERLVEISGKLEAMLALDEDEADSGRSGLQQSTHGDGNGNSRFSLNYGHLRDGLRKVSRKLSSAPENNSVD